MRMSQSELSKEICVPSYLSKIENCEIVPSEALVDDLAKRLNINVIEDQNLEEAFRKCDLVIDKLFNLRNKEAKLLFESITTDLSLTSKAHEYLTLKYTFDNETEIKSIIERSLEFHDQAQSHQLALLLYAKDKEDTELLERYYNHFGLGYFLKGLEYYKNQSYKKALDVFEQAETLFLKEGRLNGMFNAIKQQGILLALGSKYKQALSCFERLYKMVEETQSNAFPVIKRTTYYNIHYIKYILEKPNDLEDILMDYIKNKQYSNSVMFHMLFELNFAEKPKYAKSILMDGFKAFPNKESWHHQLLKMDLMKLEDPDYMNSDVYYHDVKKQIDYLYEAKNYITYHLRVKEFVQYLKMNRRYKEALELVESMKMIEL